MVDLTSQMRAEVAVRLGSLSRLAGWLGKGQSSNDTRAHVKALATAFDGQTDASPWLLLLDTDLQRVPSGEVRRMLRKELTAVAKLLSTRLSDEQPGRAR